MAQARHKANFYWVQYSRFVRVSLLRCCCVYILNDKTQIIAANNHKMHMRCGAMMSAREISYAKQEIVCGAVLKVPTAFAARGRKVIFRQSRHRHKMLLLDTHFTMPCYTKKASIYIYRKSELMVPLKWNSVNDVLIGNAVNGFAESASYACGVML